MKPTILLLLSTLVLSATSVPELLKLSRNPNTPQFQDALIATLGREALQKGTAVVTLGPDFVIGINSASTPSLFVDDKAMPAKRIKGSDLYFATPAVTTGTSHSFHWMVEGKRFGGNLNVPAYLPDCYPQPGVPQGKLSEKMVHNSKIYPGLASDWWIYAPAQYDSASPAAVMIFQDGQGQINREGGAKTLNVVDNLIHKKQIPVMLLVFISPGRIGQRAMRSIEYDTVDDTYARFLRDEILVEVAAKYNIRKDGYSRAIWGSSSGGICAWNAAWFLNDQFTRVLSHVGSFTSIQWRPGVLDGGNIWPFKVRKEPKRNIRIWMQDGSEDLENNHGSWPLQNIQLANSLKMAGYDFHLSFGTGAHNGAQGNAEFPRSLAWLWRDYDPSKTSQVYEQDPAEKDKPPFRVRIYNRGE